MKTKTKKHNEINYYLIPKRIKKVALPSIAVILLMAVFGGQWFFFEVKGKVNGWLHPVKVEAQVPEPTTPYDIICKATNGENCDVIYNLCKAESGKWLNTDEEKCVKWSVNVSNNKNGTIDYSWLQINDVHIIGRPASKGKGTITMECVYDLPCVAKWANERIKKGNGNIWTAWDNI